MHARRRSKKLAHARASDAAVLHVVDGRIPASCPKAGKPAGHPDMIDSLPMIRVGVLLCLIGCHAATDRTLTEPAAPAPTRGRAITARVALAPGPQPAQTRGTLAVMWLTVGEREAFESGKVTVGMLRDLVTRTEVIGAFDAAQDRTFTVHAPRGRIALRATVDVSTTGIESLLG